MKIPTPRELLADAAATYAAAYDSFNEGHPQLNAAFEALVEAAKAIPRDSAVDEYQKLALRTEKTPLFINDANGQPSRMLSRAMHAAMGMVTEAGEAMDMLKKHFIYGKEFDPINLIEEAGDKQWYIALLLDAIGFPMSEALTRNIAKLRARYPEGFTEEKAITRDLARERATLVRGDRGAACICGGDRKPQGAICETCGGIQ